MFTYNFPLNQFESNIKTTWQELLTDKSMCDVTLACEDKLILTHKIIISSNSSILSNILKQNLNPHPVIYLRGVEYKNLQNLINFMYQGEVDVEEEDVDDFLKVAEDLKIRGLSGEQGENLDQSKESHEKPTQNIIEPSTKRKYHQPERTITETNNVNDLVPYSLPNGLATEQLKDDTFQIPDAEENISKMARIEKPKKLAQLTCDICDKICTSSSHLKQHKVSVHAGTKYPCDECDVPPFSWYNGLRRHKRSVHDGVRYKCRKCNSASFTCKDSLKRHEALTHTDSKYSCDWCENSFFSSLIDLREHKASEHKRILYSCDQCDNISFNASSSLKQHKLSVHPDIGYKCNKCNYESKEKSGLTNHVETNHTRQYLKYFITNDYKTLKRA